MWVVTGIAKVDCSSTDGCYQYVGNRRKMLDSASVVKRHTGQIEGNNLTGSKLSLKRLKNSMSVL